MKSASTKKSSLKRRTPRKARRIPYGREAGCKYQLPEQSAEDFYICHWGLESLSEDEPYCIFHLTKSTEDEKRLMNASERAKANELDNKFNDEFIKVIGNLESNAETFIDFRGFQFPQVFFYEAFPKKADFSFAVFAYDVDFSVEVTNALPRDEHDSHRALILSKGVSFYRATFRGKANFASVEFHEDSSFEESVFEKDVSFTWSRFDKGLEVTGCEFKGEANFVGANFSKYASFSEVIFNQKALFNEATFEEVAAFYQAIFKGDAAFETAVFNNDAYFSMAVFNGNASFAGTVFNKAADFNYVTFNSQTRFTADKTAVFEERCDFRGLVLPKDADFVFFRVNLSRASFHDTNLELITFRDVKWASATTSLSSLLRGNSYLLWDEVRPLEGMRDWHDDDKTAENYRQLVINYEGKRDYDAAEFFHIGEMEIRRKKIAEWREPPSLDARKFRRLRKHIRLYKALKNVQVWLYQATWLLTLRWRIEGWWRNLRLYFNGYGVYLLSSRYGTSYAQAILVLVLMLLGFSWVFLFTGFQFGKEYRGGNDWFFEYDWCYECKFSPDALWKLLSAYREALMYSFSLITFQRGEYYEPSSWQTRFWVYVAMLFLLSQAAMVLLAIRRRFKR
jgi:uncharacterized protein YjbI with pentapeptide repeats